MKFLKPVLISIVMMCATFTQSQAKPLVVYTTFYPTQYFAERIGGELVQVVNPIPSDADPIFWTPSSKTIQAYQKADLVIINGAEFEKWVSKVSLPRRKIVNTAKPLKEDFIYFQEKKTHSHGPSGDHSHEGLDGHTWVDPLNAKIQAMRIRDALIKKLPEKKEEFEKGFSLLAKDLDDLDTVFKRGSEKFKDIPFMASHPAYNYIARRYGWNLHNLDLDPNEMPTESVLSEIKNALKNHPARFLIWESFPKAEIAHRFKKELGLQSFEFSPAELIDDVTLKGGVDYLAVMRENAKELKKGLSLGLK